MCIAGYLPDDTCVRPVFWSSHIVERWLYARLGEEPVVRPFALVEFDLQEHTPHPPHTEDWIVSEVYRERCGMLSREERKAFLARICDPDVASIFGAPLLQEDGWYVEAGQGTRSLGTVTPRRGGMQVRYAERDGGKWEYRLRFNDASGARYNLSVTDLAFRYLLDHLRDHKKYAAEVAARLLTDYFNKARVYLRIGLSRNWERYPDRCFAQITGVHTFPDYLRGKCFADFAPSG